MTFLQLNYIKVSYYTIISKDKINSIKLINYLIFYKIFEIQGVRIFCLIYKVLENEIKNLKNINNFTKNNFQQCFKEKKILLR